MHSHVHRNSTHIDRIGQLIAEKNFDGFKVVSVFLSVIIIITNGFQLRFLHKKFRKCTDSLKTVFIHLCLVDLLQGINMILLAILIIIHRVGNVQNSWLVVKIVRTIGARYLGSVSVILLNVMTIFRMIRVTRNQRLKKLLKRICKMTWIVVFVVVAVEYTAYQFFYPAEEVLRELWLPCLTIPTVLSIVVCCLRIYHVTMKNERSVSAQHSSGGKFLVVAVSQVTAYTACAGPLSIFRVLQACDVVSEDIQLFLDPWLSLLIMMNPVADSVVFFFVFRHKFMRQRRGGGEIRITSSRMTVCRTEG